MQTTLRSASCGCASIYRPRLYSCALVAARMAVRVLFLMAGPRHHVSAFSSDIRQRSVYQRTRRDDDSSLGTKRGTDALADSPAFAIVCARRTRRNRLFGCDAECLHLSVLERRASPSVRCAWISRATLRAHDADSRNVVWYARWRT